MVRALTDDNNALKRKLASLNSSKGRLEKEKKDLIGSVNVKVNFCQIC